MCRSLPHTTCRCVQRKFAVAYDRSCWSSRYSKTRPDWASTSDDRRSEAHRSSTATGLIGRRISGLMSIFDDPSRAPATACRAWSAGSASSDFPTGAGPRKPVNTPRSSELLEEFAGVVCAHRWQTPAHRGEQDLDEMPPIPNATIGPNRMADEGGEHSPMAVDHGLHKRHLRAIPVGCDSEGGSAIGLARGESVIDV